MIRNNLFLEGTTIARLSSLPFLSFVLFTRKRVLFVTFENARCDRIPFFLVFTFVDGPFEILYTST